MHPASRMSIGLAAFVIGAALAFLPVHYAEAQERPNDGTSQQGPSQRNGVGGTSWTLSDVWGEPKMPEPSYDYPGFDYPPGGYDLNGPPSQSPYPN